MKMLPPPRPSRFRCLNQSLKLAQAFVMTTAKETADEGPSALWVVLTDSPILAIETARASGYPVDVIVGRLSEETVHQLGIHFGEARRL
jgi:hypothetical protein